MGTPAFAVPTLESLANSHHQVLAVCTQPDRPAGRGYKLAPSPVKIKAMEYGLPVLQPQTLRFADSKEVRAQLNSFGADIFVVAAYGLLLPKGILNMPPLGCVNVHASLLPKYRGASPIHAALLNGDTASGITIIHMDAGLDTGDMILSKELTIHPDERFPELHDRMAELGADALLEALQLLENGNASRTPQDSAISSYAPMLQKSDAIVNWQLPTQRLINQTRAFDPWPGSQTMYDGKTLKIWRVEAANYEAIGVPGTVIAVNPTHGVLIKTGDSAVWVTELQGDGSKRMPAIDYLRGREIKVGAVLI